MNGERKHARTRSRAGQIAELQQNQNLVQFFLKSGEILFTRGKKQKGRERGSSLDSGGQ